MKKGTNKRKWSAPTTPSLLMILILIIAITTYFIPAGEYERVIDDDTGRELIVSESFEYVDQSPVGPMTILSSIYEGIIDAADIIAFVFVVGGVFGVIIKSGAIHSVLSNLISRLHGRESWFIILTMTLFAIGGATFGMAEESLPFIALMVATVLAMGYDRIVAVSIVVVGIYAGYTAGPINPFNVGIAQGIAELPLFSGIGLRSILLLGGLAIAVHHTVKYANRVKRNPDSSFIANLEVRNEENVSVNDEKVTSQHKLILAVLSLSLIALIFGVLQFDWYLAEISALMMLMGLIVGLIAFKGSFNKFTAEFMKGTTQMTTAALIIGISRAILVVTENGQIMDTLVYAISLPLAGLSTVFAATGMFISQGLINFIIPSSTGQAAVIMPIMTSISDVIEINRQVAVLAYQTGDGYLNMITPTQPVLMAALGIAAVPFGNWVRFSGPLVIKWSIWAVIILTIAVITGWGPF